MTTIKKVDPLSVEVNYRDPEQIDLALSHVQATLRGVRAGTENDNAIYGRMTAAAGRHDYVLKHQTPDPQFRKKMEAYRDALQELVERMPHLSGKYPQFNPAFLTGRPA